MAIKSDWVYKRRKAKCSEILKLCCKTRMIHVHAGNIFKVSIVSLWFVKITKHLNLCSYQIIMMYNADDIKADDFQTNIYFSSPLSL